MFEHKTNSQNNETVIKVIGILICCIMFGSALLGGAMMWKDNASDKNFIIAEADENEKEYKWTKKIVEKDTTINAEYLWPDETNASFTTVYRDGKPLSDEKMITITPGSVYHFRGISDTSILYTEVYVGASVELDITAGESGTWYNLLPSAIRKTFETEGWSWQIGWEYTGRGYLDKDNSRVMIKENEPTAVLYGMGLYLDDKYKYSDESTITENTSVFTDNFGSTDNVFASALEYYYTKGGELQSVCPEIYTMVGNAVSEPNSKTGQTQSNTETPKKPKSDKKISDKSVLVNDLLAYVNKQRESSGLSPIIWDEDNNGSVSIRAKEITQKLSQTRPNGKDAFSAYTEPVKCEIRIANAGTVEDIYNSASSYFKKKDLKAINCATYKNMGILIFVW